MDKVTVHPLLLRLALLLALKSCISPPSMQMICFTVLIVSDSSLGTAAKGAKHFDNLCFHSNLQNHIAHRIGP